MSKLFAVVLLLSSSHAFASESVLGHIISVKDQVRISLWHEGVKPSASKVKHEKKETSKKLPIQLLAPLNDITL